MLVSLLVRCGQYLQSLDLSASPRLLTDFSMDIIGKFLWTSYTHILTVYNCVLLTGKSQNSLRNVWYYYLICINPLTH